jgi:hypothetical protein
MNRAVGDGTINFWGFSGDGQEGTSEGVDAQAGDKPIFVKDL